MMNRPRFCCAVAILLIGPLNELRADFIVFPGPNTVQGIDVFQGNGPINWNAVAGAGIGFAFARVGDGLSVDANFSTNWQGMAGAGLVRGAYQFFEPSIDPVAQANHMLQQMGTLQPGDLPPILDVEVNPSAQSPAVLLQNINSWISTVEAATGRQPIIYTGRTFWDNNIGHPATIPADLDIAQFGGAGPSIPSPPWFTWDFWQFSDTGSVSGVPTAVDLEEFNGDLAALQALATPVPEPSAFLYLVILAASATVFHYRRHGLLVRQTADA